MTKKNKTLTIRLVLLFGTIVSLAYVPWILVKAWIMPLPKTVKEQMEDSINQGFDGIIVYIQKGSEPAVVYSAGWHDREFKMVAYPEAYFKIASISKLYSAVAIARLVNNKSLSLDKTLADYFPELKDNIENAEKISLRMLVQHKSGIPNYTDSPNYWSAPATNYQSKLELILDLPANFEPGEDYEYSNTNYLLLSKLIEKTTGKKRFQFIKDEILTPLNLNNTFGSLNDINIENLMGGYHVDVAENIKTNGYGSMIATVEDVGVFLRALINGTVFDVGGQEVYASIYEYEHGGWVPGYQSHAKYFKDIDTVVIQFNNTTDAKLYFWNLSEIILSRIEKILKKNNG